MSLGQNKKILLYSLILLVGFYFVVVSKESSTIEFFVAISINTLMLVIMIFNIWKVSTNKLLQLGLPEVTGYSTISNMLYHFVLPVLALVDFCLLIYFNSFVLFRPILLLLVFITYFLVFVNIRAYFEDKFKLELSTHFIYTFIILISGLSLTNAVLNITNLYSLNILVPFFALVIINIFLILTAFIHYWDYNLKKLVSYLFFSLVLAGLTIMIFLQFDSTLRSAFIEGIILYFVLAIIHHKYEASLTLGIVFEYVIITLLGFVLLYGAN